MLVSVIGIMIGWPIFGLAAMGIYIVYRSVRIAIKCDNLDDVVCLLNEFRDTYIEPGNKIDGSFGGVDMRIEVSKTNPDDINERANNRFKNTMLWPRTLLIFRTMYNDFEKNKFNTAKD